MKKLFVWLAIPFSIFIVTNLAQALTFDEVNFYDVENLDPSKKSIMYLKENDIVHGYSDGSFKPKSKINRAEFLKIVVGSMEDFDINVEKGKNCFSDVEDEWFAKYVCYAKKKGVVSGYPDGTFRPAENINFAEASKIVANAFDIDPSDTSNVDPWYRTFVEPLAELKAIPTSISDLDKSIARGEMAEVIYRVKEKAKEDESRDSLNYEDLEGVPVTGKSCSDLKELFDEELNNNRYYMYDDDIVFMEDMAVEESAEIEAPASPPRAVSDTSSKQSAGIDGSNDFSETNVQVQGVDEADFVKNDGKYIYMVKGNEIRIIEAYPADSMKEVATIKLDGENNYSINEIYADGDTLVVIGQEWYYNYGYAKVAPEVGQDMIAPNWYPHFHQDRAFTAIYNMSNRSNPRLARKLTFDGNYTSSRKVGDTLYMVLNKYNRVYEISNPDFEPEVLLPRFKDSKMADEEQFLTTCGEIAYFPRARSMNYVIALAIPLKNNGEIASEVMIGNGENIYASKDSLYIASTNYERDNFTEFYQDWDNAKTVVYRYELSPGEIEYADRGKVPGTILNQFSMDEHKDHFRIATTQGNFWDTNNIARNNLYVLDADMDIVGSIEDIAPGEKIYSTRFMGDRGYMVTFRNIDPLFAFDLSDPRNPRIIGKLKIPGYSDYLHPYDENHIIGFGKDAIPAKEGDRRDNFAWYQGMKIALFDVTDMANPKQMFTELIGDRGTQSELLSDHKALLFDREKGLLAFPVQVAEVKDKTCNDIDKCDPEEVSPSAYGQTVFDGAYVYTLDLENGFQLRGKISHYSEADEDYIKQGDYWYGDYDKHIRRILYIGKNLYTVADGGIKASDMNTTEEKNYLELEPSYNYDDEIYEEEMPPTPGGIIRNLFQ